MTTIRHAFAAAAGLALLSGPIQGATIYSETFSDGSVGTPSALNGSTPDVTTGAAAWVASDWQENGSTGTIATSTNFSDDDSAFLPFAPVAGKIYTLSATMTVPTGGETTGWVAIGFAQTNTTTGNFYANNAAPWILYRPNTNTDSFLGLGTANLADEGNHAGSAVFSIVLDTTAPFWTAEWFIGASSVRSATFATLGTNPTINYVGFGRENGNTTAIDNFTVSVVPEPSSALIGALGLVALFRRRR